MSVDEVGKKEIKHYRFFPLIITLLGKYLQR